MIRVSTQTKSSRQVGIPYSYYSKPSTLSTFVRNQEIPCSHAKSLPAAQIVNETSEFSTRAFVIKYRDERLELNEGVQFQLLIESRVEEAKDGSGRLVFENDEPITVKLDLLMAELEKPTEDQPNAKYRGNTVAAEKPSSSPTFTRIASQTMCVVGDAASQQLHAYFPATFSAMHFCQLRGSEGVIRLPFNPSGPDARVGQEKGSTFRDRSERMIARPKTELNRVDNDRDTRLWGTFSPLCCCPGQLDITVQS